MDVVFVNANRSKRVIWANRKPESFEPEVGSTVTFANDPEIEWEVVSSKIEGGEMVVRMKALPPTASK